MNRKLWLLSAGLGVSVIVSSGARWDALAPGVVAQTAPAVTAAARMPHVEEPVHAPTLAPPLVTTAPDSAPAPRTIPDSTSVPHPAPDGGQMRLPPAPPLRDDSVPPVPGAGYEWVDGQWIWHTEKKKYEWKPGYWRRTKPVFVATLRGVRELS